MKILVTGASGFIGNFLLAALRDGAHEVRAASRSRVEQRGIDYVSAPELGPDADWSRALNGVDVVIHLAGRAHVPSKNADAETEEVYFRINAEGTHGLAEQAAAVGVKHFVFLSSCHAVAAESEAQITEKTQPNPVTATDARSWRRSVRFGRLCRIRLVLGLFCARLWSMGRAIRPILVCC